MTDDFDLLESILSTEPATEETPPTDCPHIAKTIDRGMIVCRHCGSSEKINDGQTYTSHKMYRRSTKNTNISSVLEQKGFDSRVIVISNQMYNIVIDENAKRTGNRNSIIAAIVFQAFKVLKRPVDYIHIYSKFDLKKRSALKGLKIVNAEIAKRKDLDIHTIVSSPILPENFILSYMEELKAPDASIKEVLRMYEKIQDCRELNMSRPQSIAAGVIYHYLRTQGLTEAMKIIEVKANLSALTINKKSKLVAQRLEQLGK